MPAVPEGSRPDRMSDVFSGRFSVHICHSTSAFGERYVHVSSIPSEKGLLNGNISADLQPASIYLHSVSHRKTKLK